MSKAPKIATWRYKTEHVDLMLYQYCVALQDFSKIKALAESDLQTLNYLAAQRYTFLSECFKVEPSFRVKFIIHNGLASIEKESSQPVNDQPLITQIK